MDNPAVVAAWAAAIAAVIGPVVAVIAAHQMGQQENKRQEASKLFRRIVSNCTEYGTVVSNTHSIMRRYFTDSEEFARVREDIKSERFRIRTLSSAMAVDILSLGLLFERQGTDCIDAINYLTEAGLMIDTDDYEETESYRGEILKRISRVTEAIGQLHKSLRRPDSFGDEI